MNKTQPEMPALLRKDYVAGKVTHSAYYGQYVTTELKRQVVRIIGKGLILASKDQHFNDIGLSKWDRVGNVINTARLHRIAKAAGTWIAPSDLVCIAKEAARQIQEERKKQ